MTKDNTVAIEDQQLIEEISALRPITTIKTDKQQQVAADLLAIVKTNGKALKARKEAITKPLNAALKEIRSQFKPAEDQLARVETAVKAALLEYHDVKEAAAQAEIDRIENDKRLRTDTAMTRLANVETPETDLGGAQIKYGPRKVKITDVHALIKHMPQLLDTDRVMEAIRMELAPDLLSQDEADTLPAGVEIYRERLVAGIAG